MTINLNGHGVMAALTTVAGVVLSPAVANVLPPQYAAILSALGAIYGLFANHRAMNTPAPSQVVAPAVDPHQPAPASR